MDKLAYHNLKNLLHRRNSKGNVLNPAISIWNRNSLRKLLNNPQVLVELKDRQDLILPQQHKDQPASRSSSSSTSSRRPRTARAATRQRTSASTWPRTSSSSQSS